MSTRVDSDLLFWESLAILEDQHWVARSFSGRGDFDFGGCLRFSGEWKGVIRSSKPESHLFVLPGARISGTIQVDKLTVEGQLHDADVQVGYLRALKGCRIRGRVRAQRLVIEEGAIIEGRILSDTEGETPVPPREVSAD